MAAIRRWAPLSAALVALNTSLTFDNVWPTLFIRLTAAISIELAVLVLCLVLWRRWRGPSRPDGGGSRAVWRGAAIGWTVLVFVRYVDVTVRALYGREINLYWDLQFAPDVSAMFAFVANPWLAAAVVLGVVMIPLVVFVPALWSLRRLAAAAELPRARAVLGGLAAGALLLHVVQGVSGRMPTVLQFSRPVTPTFARVLTEYAEERLAARPLPPAPRLASNLARVKGADVFLIFLESYGAVSWQRPEFVEALADSRRALEQDIEASGRSVVSAMVGSTTFGGESWLAHISLLSGTEVRDQRTNLRLMADRRDTLVTVFGRQGYRTVAIMPGLLRGWPEGAFYGFDTIYDHARLGYQGPPFGWWDLNDQFALARADAAEIAPQPRQPAFVFFPTITTHAPFTPAPPYQPDWARVLTRDAYDQAEVDRAWLDTPDWTNLGPSYIQALRYAQATVGGYLRLRADRDFVVILMGDHQPPGLVSGAGASWDVPVHVIATRPDLLDRLRRHGFRDGLTPPDAALARIDQLLPILLDAFGDEASGVEDAEVAAR